MIIKIIIGMVLLIFVGNWIWSRRKLYQLSWKLPGPFSLPIIGNGLSLMVEENLLYLDAVCKTYKSPISLWLGPRLVIYTDNADDVETIMSAPCGINRERSYDVIAEGLGLNGLFTLKPNQWKNHRKLVGPLLNNVTAIRNLPVFNKHSNDLVSNLLKHADCEIDIKELVTKFAIDSFLEATLCSNLSDYDKEQFTYYISHGQSLVAKRIFLPMYRIELFWKMSPSYKLLMKYQTFGNEIFERVISNRSNKVGNSTFVEKLITVAEENDDFGDEDVKAETATVLAAATDTSGSTISFVLLMLAMYPDVQQRVYHELRSILKFKNCPIERKHLEDMVYLERCINETMRLFPIISTIARECEENSTLRLHDLDIIPGITIGIGIRQIHRNTKYWGENPDQFNPDNFLPEFVKNRHPNAFLPFGAGPRICIGMRYAMVVMKTVIANVIGNYRLTTKLKISDLKLRMNINLLLLNKHMVEIHSRE